MQIVTDFPHAVRIIETAWIPLSDGTRLAAKIWLPEGAETSPVPAVVELLPYRRSDGTVIRDERRYPYLAGNGFAGVRIDLRGSGDSDGVLDDEYSAQEQDDAMEAVAWVAEQEWCTGAVGMWGISWGGFNALQLAARRPPALKAIVTMMSTDDRYADDVHYRGGLVLGLDMVHWATYMLLANAQPPDPAAVGERWRDMWQERLDADEPLIRKWLAHQRRDEYWKHGSVCEDFSAIECAVYAVGGWQDGYTNAVPRLLEGLSAPRKGVIGPWGHCFPEAGTPGPAIGFLQECVRWWDHWLKGEDTGIMDEPMLQAYVHDSVRPQPTYLARPGRWLGVESWPPPQAQAQRRHLTGDGLRDSPGAEVSLAVQGRQTSGIEASGPWCGEGETADDPDDQRRDDGESLCFDSEPLGEELAVLGFPRVGLDLASDRPLALVCVRLCEVLPDGASKLVSRAILNLTHRDGHEYPAPLEPGERYPVEVQLDCAGHVFATGSRIRVAVSPSYWPWAWPSPQPVTLSVHTSADSWLELPRIPAGWVDARPFGKPEASAGLEYRTLAKGHTERIVTRDLRSGTAELRFLWDSGGDHELPSGMRVLFENDAVYRITEGDPLSAQVTVTMGIVYERRADGWRTRVDAVGDMRCTADAFVVESRVTADEGERRVFERSWRDEFPRDLG
jgi:putative CocE/NonD family hydrolase